MLIGGAQLDNPAAPLNDLLRFGLQTKPGEVALLSAVRSLTWSELEEASSRVAAGYLGSARTLDRRGHLPLDGEAGVPETVSAA